MYLKANNNDSTLHYNRLLSGDGSSAVKSTSHLLDSDRKYQQYEQLSEKIDRNKKMIEQLRKTAKIEKDLLKNVSQNKTPSYIDLDQPN